MPGRCPGCLVWQWSSPGGARLSCGDGGQAVVAGLVLVGVLHGRMAWPGLRCVAAPAAACLPLGCGGWIRTAHLLFELPFNYVTWGFALRAYVFLGAFCLGGRGGSAPPKRRQEHMRRRTAPVGWGYAEDAYGARGAGAAL